MPRSLEIGASISVTKSDKEDMFIILSIMLLVTWYDQSIGYRLGVAGVYIALGTELPDGSWGVRIQDKPLVRWVWLGALMMAFGGVLAVTDPRYRRLRARMDSGDRLRRAGGFATT